jgi:aerobic carbon-monoxide dehydrogenase medium subunit
MIPNRFEYFRPASLQEAIALLSRFQDDAKVLAGGQSLVSLLKLRLANPKYLVDLGGIGNLSYIREEKDGKIAIGAMTPYVEVKDSTLLQRLCPILPKAASVVGDVQIRNRGTFGGAIAHADPAGDVPAAVLAVRADIKVAGPKGERWVKVEDFFQGMYATELAPDEILTEVRVPVLTGWKSNYLKAARRPSDFAIVGVAACFRLGADQSCNDIAIAVTGVTDRPYRALAVEGKLRGTRLDPKAIEAAAPAITEGVEVSGNMHASPEFRAHLARVYLARTIQSAS